MIAMRLKRRAWANLAVGVLRELHARGASAPGVPAFDGAWMVQEDLGQRWFSQALSGTAEAEIEKWLTAALDSLARIHQAGRAAGLGGRVPRTATKTEWLPKFAQTPRRLGDQLKLAGPESSGARASGPS